MRGFGEMDIRVKPLEAEEVRRLVAVFSGTAWFVSRLYFEGFLKEQERGERTVLLAYAGEDIAGYVTIKWLSYYPPFTEAGVPEINDLRVLPGFRRRGIGSALVDEAERRIFERSPVAGIGVGMYSDYGPAQRMYVRRGYVPDGKGLYSGKHPVVPGRDVCVDDGLVLYFVKERGPGR